MEKIVRWGLGCALAVVLALVLFSGGLVAGLGLSQTSTFRELAGAGPVIPASDSGAPAELASTFAPFWEAWDIVHNEYVDQPLDDTQLMRGAIRGMLEALGDPHTSYMTPEEYAVFSTGLSGNFEGIGAYVDLAGDYLRIVSLIPGSPAEAAGILADDVVVKVNDEDIAGQSLDIMISKVRGPAGTTVHLTIQRQGETDFLEFDVVRAKISIPSVESKMLEGNIAYVKLNTFGATTADELRATLKTLLAKKPVGLVFDLRGNGGGYLSAAVSVASEFIGDGLVLREKFGDGTEKTYDVESGGLATDIPLVVLIDKGSASASEIVAGAIQDHKRGTLVGETSYGKGSVQLPHDLAGNNGQVKITIARWLTPDGRFIHGVGITPDVEVIRTAEDRTAKRDPQLDKALELLQATP